MNLIGAIDHYHRQGEVVNSVVVLHTPKILQ